MADVTSAHNHFSFRNLDGQPSRHDGARLSEQLGLEDMAPNAVRQSMVADYAACPRYFLWKDRFGLVRKGHKSAPFIGQLFHLAMGAYYKGLAPVQVEQATSGYVQEYINTLVAETESTVVGFDTVDIMNRVNRDAAKALAMAAVYWKRFPLDSTAYEVIAVEQELTVDLPSPLGRIAGRIDLMLRHKQEPAGLFVVDHKTTSRDLNTFMSCRSYSTQLRLYRLLAEAYSERHFGLPVHGMIYNLIQRPSIHVKTWQSFNEYLQEMDDWYDGKVDSQATEVYKTGPKKGLPKPRWDHSGNVERWALSGLPIRHHVCRYTEQNMPADFSLKLQLVGRACRADASLENFPTLGVDNDRCTDMYGRACPYLPLCSSEDSFYHSIISRMFEQRQSVDDSADADDYLT